MPDVLTTEEMEGLSHDSLHRLGEFLRNVETVIADLERANAELEEELAMALACLKDSAVKRG